jgi:polycomb protein SCMH1
MNGKNRSSVNKKSPVKQPVTPQQQHNRCTWCVTQKTPLKYVLPTQNGKKEFCSETCIADFRKAYSKGACKECDNAIRNGPNRDFCSTYCLNKNNKKKATTSGNQPHSTQAPSTSQHNNNKIVNNNNNSLENNNSKLKSSVETNNNNTIKEHYAVTKISPMFQYEAFHVFDWNEYLKVSQNNCIILHFHKCFVFVVWFFRKQSHFQRHQNVSSKP